jgi:hypothetical protein
VWDGLLQIFQIKKEEKKPTMATIIGVMKSFKDTFIQVSTVSSNFYDLEMFMPISFMQHSNLMFRFYNLGYIAIVQ